MSRVPGTMNRVLRAAVDVWSSPGRSRIRARAVSAREDRSLAEKWEWGYAVRVDWPDGTHGFAGWRADVDAALRQLNNRRDYWVKAPMTSPAWTIVAANRDLVRHHQDQCRSANCPSEIAADPPGWRAPGTAEVPTGRHNE